MPQLSYVKVIVGCPASDVFVTLTTHRNQGTGGILPPQILVGIKAKNSSSKDLRLLFFPSDFQIFLRPCSTVPREQLLLQPSLSTSLCNCAIKVVGIKGFHLLSYYFFEQSFFQRRILEINWKINLIFHILKSLTSTNVVSSFYKVDFQNDSTFK